MGNAADEGPPRCVSGAGWPVRRVLRSGAGWAAGGGHGVSDSLTDLGVPG